MPGRQRGGSGRKEFQREEVDYEQVGRDGRGGGGEGEGEGGRKCQDLKKCQRWMWWSGGKVLKFGITSMSVRSLRRAGHESGSERMRRRFFKVFHDLDWKLFFPTMWHFGLILTWNTAAVAGVLLSWCSFMLYNIISQPSWQYCVDFRSLAERLKTHTT